MAGTGGRVAVHDARCISIIIIDDPLNAVSSGFSAYISERRRMVVVFIITTLLVVH